MTAEDALRIAGGLLAAGGFGALFKVYTQFIQLRERVRMLEDGYERLIDSLEQHRRRSGRHRDEDDQG